MTKQTWTAYNALQSYLSKALIMLLLLLCGTASATTYYVNDTSGDDAYDGNLTHPFKTIQAGADVVTAGDTVIVQNGTYTDSNGLDSIVYINKKRGNATHWITFKSEHHLGAILDGVSGARDVGFYLYYNPTYCDQQAYVNITGFEIKDVMLAGIQLRSCYDIVIYMNKIHGVGRDNPDTGCTGGPGATGGILSHPETMNVTVDRNEIYDIGRQYNAACGYDVYHYDHNIYASGYNWTITNNILYNAYFGWLLKLDDNLLSKTGRSHYVGNNVFGHALPHGNLGHIGIVNADADEHIVIENNIGYNTSEGEYGVGKYFIWNRIVLDSDDVFRNNVFSNSLWYNKPGYGSGTPTTANNTDNLSLSNFNMTDPENNDFTLLSTASYLIGEGISNSDTPAYDFAGVIRGDPPDIGAYEYVAGNPSPNITSWENNDTNDNTLAITVDANQNVKFNATANQTITTWTWKQDTVDQTHNYDNITLNWSSIGSKTATVTATNSNGTSSAIEWTVTVAQIGTFNYYKEILINHSMVYEDLTNFSVSINFTDSDLSDHAQADGDDIVFRSNDQVTQLDHEQESWNKTTGEYVGWVRVPAVNSTVNTTIYMYYNNSDAVNSENPAGVWDDNYKAVYHMPETPPGTIYDSTSNDNDAATSGMDSADQVTGQIDGALDFDEVNDYLYTGVDTSLDCGNNLTITTYMQRDDALIPASEYQSMVIYRIGTTSSQYCLYWNEDERLQAWIYDDAWHSFTGTTQVQNTDPHRIDFVWNGTDAWTYIDGAQDNTGAFAYTPNNGNEVLWIGSDSGTANREFDGIIDETRISNTPRSAGWISTGYNNTAYPTLFLIVGAEQSAGSADTKFEYWDSAAWIEDEAEYYLWFECFWITSGYPDGVAPNAEQTDTQHTLKITNNGTAAGTPKIKLNETTPAAVTVYVDNDHTVAGAVSITDTYQAVAPPLSAGENVTLSAWVNLTGLTSTWEYEVYAIVE